MSLTMQYNESLYEVLFKYLMESMEMPLLTSKTLKMVFAVGFIIIIFYALYHIRKYRYTKFIPISGHNTKLQKIENNHHSSIRSQSIITHKKMLSDLEHAADKCYNKLNAIKCVDIVVCCPYLINIKSPLSGLTPFHRICFHGHTCLIVFMLGKGADPFITTGTGENALCMAIYHFLTNPMKNDFSCLEVLRKTGCNLGSDDKWYDSFLKAALNNHTKLAQWLILHFKTSSHKIIRCSSTPPVSTLY